MPIITNLRKSIYEKHPQGLPRPAYDRTLEGVLASPRVLLPATRDVEIERMLALRERTEAQRRALRRTRSLARHGPAEEDRHSVLRQPEIPRKGAGCRPRRGRAAAGS